MNPGSSVIDPRSYVTASAAGATRSIFDPRTVTTTFRCTARPSKTCAARIVTGAPACCAGRLVAPASKISKQVRTRLVIGFTLLRMISEIAATSALVFGYIMRAFSSACFCSGVFRIDDRLTLQLGIGGSFPYGREAKSLFGSLFISAGVIHIEDLYSNAALVLTGPLCRESRCCRSNRLVQAGRLPDS